jgi:hypothetical protein
MTPTIERALLEPEPFAWVEANGIELTDDEAEELAAAIAADDATEHRCPDWTDVERRAGVERYIASGKFPGAVGFADA